MDKPTELSEYNEQLNHFRKCQEWEEMVHYCQTIERRIRKAITVDTATIENKRLRMQALLDLMSAYMLLERPKERLRTAQEFHSALRRTPSTDGRLDDFYSYKFLAQAHEANDQLGEAREMYLRAGVSMITKHQAEWFGSALIDLANLEREEGNLEIATTLTGLADGIKRVSKRAK